ncbi:MAG TPA: Gldg family protein, partial [Woeseiaceae bacterium]
MLPPWVIYQQAQQLFDLRNLGPDTTEIDDDIGLLWIVQPKELPDETLYAIDQYLLSGGKALIFVDPLAEADAMAMQGMPQGMPPQGQGSDLPKLFSAWGLEFSSSEVVGDAGLALQVAAGPNRRPTRHLGLLGVTQSELSQDDITTADLESINIGTAGSLRMSGDGGPTFEPLITSSDRAGLLPVSRFSFLPDPATLLDSFSPGEERLVIAGRLSGSLRSAFPDGPPDSATDQDGDSAAPEDERGHLVESSDDANIIIVADVDLLSDRMWVQTQNFFGQQVATAFADNGTFVTNALDNLSGSNDLIDVRSRATSARPFTKVEELRRDAESRFRETEQNLQRELDETEQRLGSLQSAREDAGNLLMTEEQQAEIDRFIDRRTEIRQELRAVQRGLDRDIERLGTNLKIINVALVPLLLTVFVLFAVWRRNRGRRV